MKNEVYVVRSNGETEKPAFGAKGRFILHKGDKIVLRTPGGGGYGSPLERDRKLILKDIVNELLSIGEAERSYGIEPVTEEELNNTRQGI